MALSLYLVMRPVKVREGAYKKVCIIFVVVNITKHGEVGELTHTLTPAAKNRALGRPVKNGQRTMNSGAAVV